MSTEIKLPQIGFSVTEGTLVEWLVADGQKVEEGAPLYTLELEKSVQEVVAPGSGTLKIKAKPGEVYQVGALLGEIV